MNNNEIEQNGNHLEECKSYYVYKHTSPSGKVYIGITRQKCTKRWQAGGGYSYNTHFINAINKFGWENFTHEILFSDLTEQEAKEKEIELIAFYDSSNRNKGYNISPGGNIVSIETQGKIQKTREANGVNEKERNRMLSVWADPQKREMIVSKMQNKPRTEEQKQHYRESSARRGKPLPNTTKEKLSEIAKTKIGSKSPRAKSVCQISPVDGSIVRSFSTARQAAIEIGDKSISAISNLCRGEGNKKQFKNGFYWCYANDYDEFIKRIELNPELSSTGRIRRKPEESGQFGKAISEYQKLKISEAHRKAVVCIETGIIYKSIRDAAKANNINSPEMITRQIKGIIKKAGGYSWRLLTDEEGSE